MMKKVLVLLLVLGLCNSAFAVLAIQPVSSGTTDTEIWVEESEIFYIDLIWLNDVLGPPGELSSADISIHIEGPASVVDIETLTFNPDYIPAAGVFNGSFVVPDGVGLSVTSWSAGADPGEVIIDHIGFHCDGLGEVMIWAMVEGQPLTGGAYVDWGYVLDPDQGGPGTDLGYGLIVHQIPEPMTVALLGLGGLFLTRRKRK
jgi:hypothetical protein